MRLVINAQRLQPEHLAAIRRVAPDLEIVETTNSDQLSTALPKADILLGWNRDLSPDMWNKLPQLRWVHVFSAGVEGLLSPEFKASRVVLTNSRGAHGIPIAEHVMAMLLSWERNLSGYARNQVVHQWERLNSREIYGRTLGILGLGGIGRQVAVRAKGFGLRVVGLRRSAAETGGDARSDGYAEALFGPEQLHQFLAELDYLVIAAPLTSATRGMIGAAELAAMRSDAVLINIARGPIVDEAALVESLKGGQLRAALLDVFDKEPLPAGSPLWDLPNVMITPHSSANSHRTVDRGMEIFLENLRRFREGRPLVAVVDPNLEY